MSTRTLLQKKIRKLHRYLGVILGIQLLLWTLGGLYFSWTSIDTIRGDDLKKEAPLPNLKEFAVSPSQVVDSLHQYYPLFEPQEIEPVAINGQAFYQVSGKLEDVKKYFLLDAKKGKLRPPLSREEAVQMAKDRLNRKAEVCEVVRIDSTGPHHEYREQPLPAYAVTFCGPVNTTVYVAAELGTVRSFRNKQWRIFDFLWMLHTMDFQGRDNINNWVLRIFSLLGLMALLSGFLLYLLTSRRFSFLFPRPKKTVL